ncbi:MAG: hypothetical protein ACRES7_02340 [Gammaproteobacteria bacterium]
MNTQKILMTMASAALFAGVAVQVRAAPTAADGQRILSKTGDCEMTVPADWKIDHSYQGSADSPDKSASALVTSPHTGFTLAQAKTIVEGSMKPVKVFADTPQRLWYQYQTDQGFGWYVGVPFKGGVCGTQISFDKAAQADMAKQIALSIKATQ